MGSGVSTVSEREQKKSRWSLDSEAIARVEEDFGFNDYNYKHDEIRGSNLVDYADKTLLSSSTTSLRSTLTPPVGVEYFMDSRLHRKWLTSKEADELSPAP